MPQWSGLFRRALAAVKLWLYRLRDLLEPYHAPAPRFRLRQQVRHHFTARYRRLRRCARHHFRKP